MDNDQNWATLYCGCSEGSFGERLLDRMPPGDWNFKEGNDNVSLSQ